MGNKQVATTNLGIGPWTTYETAVKTVKSGDLILLSARNIYGNTVRFTNRALWSHVGIIVKSKQFNEVYVMMVAVERESVYSCYHARNDNDRKLLLSTMLQPLRSVLFSGLYNFAAYRTIAWRSDVDVELMMTENFPPSNQEDVVLDTHIRDDYFTSRLLNLSSSKTKVPIHPSKFAEVYQTLFQNETILAASGEDLCALASAEYVAYIFFKLGIFVADNPHTMISKFYGGHFSSLTPYRIPFNKDMVHGINRENYIYLDHQVWKEDIIVPSMPIPPESIPPIRSSVLQTYNTDWNYLKGLRLKTGDLIFFREEGVIAEAVVNLTKSVYTRVAMIVKPVGLNKLLVLDAPSWHVTKTDLYHPEPKLLEQRVICLDGLLMSGAYSRVSIRRLVKEANVLDVVETKVYAYVHLDHSSGEPVRERIREVYEQLETEYSSCFTFDVSCILSSYFIAMAYQQMGLLPDTDPFRWLNMTTNDWDNINLATGFSIGPEETLSSCSTLQFLSQRHTLSH